MFRQLIGTLLAAALIGGCAHAPVNTGDVGFIVKKEKEIKWDLRVFPIVVYVDPNLDENTYLALIAAIQEMNTIVGRTVFLQPRLPSKQSDFDGFNGAGAILVMPVKGEQTRGLTRHFIDGVKYTITNALVFLPTTGNYREDLQFALHELGHVLGLEHDELEESLMYKNLHPNEYPQDLTAHDRKLLRDTYGRQ